MAWWKSKFRGRKANHTMRPSNLQLDDLTMNFGPIIGPTYGWLDYQLQDAPAQPISAG